MQYDYLTPAQVTAIWTRMLQGVQWVWLDLDDTLIDFHANSRAALAEVYDSVEPLRVAFGSPDRWRDCYLRHNHALWALYNRAQVTQDYLRMHRFTDPLAEATGLDAARFEPLAAELDRLYLDTLAAQRALVPGALALLNWLRGHGYSIGVLSNGFTGVQHRKLRSAAIDGKVDLVVLSDDIGVNKPDVRLYRHAMERAGDTDPSRHLMVGDNPDTDIAGALGAGWRAVWLDDKADAPGTDASGTLSVPSLELLTAG